jgi:excisionase family DNA binding protein
MNSNGVVEYEAMPDNGAVPMKLLLTISEATHVLAISRSKLYGLLNSGHLPSVHIGRSRRIRMTDLEDFVKVGGHVY